MISDAELGKRMRERMRNIGKVRSKKKLAAARRNVKKAQAAAKKKQTVKIARAARARKLANNGQAN